MQRKILMALMGLEIGGAETHVVELSRALKHRGYEIIIVSNGGVYEKELKDEGIRCYHAPLHRRNVLDMLRSLRILRRVIREEKPDMVHAHARIPAFLCGILQKSMHFPFVTSAHWVFYVNRWLRAMSNWGDRTVAVSDDIRDYLKENYGIPNEHVTVTINGIDTEKFSPAVSGNAVRAEFGFANDRPTVSYVSRMDESRALVARHLIEIAPRLREAIPGIQILIAGGGDVFDELSARADAVNRDAGERFVVMTGARTDINRIVAAGDVFVGVSRAALEAMAAEKPVVVAGNEGYIGVFDADKLALAQENNFCCRGCVESSAEQLYRDLTDLLLNRTAEERAALGKYGREVIMQHYSVDRMAQDCEKAYREAWELHTHILLSGYYGYRNLGDDAILLQFCEKVKRDLPLARLTVLSRNPKETRKVCKCGAVFRFSPCGVARALRDCTVLVSGGGSLLQDRTSTRSFRYYSYLIRKAKKLGKRVIFYANGIGPVTKESNRKKVHNTCEAADLITLRDADSQEELRRLNVKNTNITVTADPIYGMESEGDWEEGIALLQSHGVPTEKTIIGVSVRVAKGMETDYKDFAALCDRISEKATVVFLVMQSDADAQVAKQIGGMMKEPYYMIETPYQPQEMMRMLACMDAVISTRLHGLIFAACEAVPMLGVVYDPKVEACLKTLQMPSIGDLQGFDAQKAETMVDDLLENRDVYRAKLQETVRELRAKAAENDALMLQELKW